MSVFVYLAGPMTPKNGYTIEENVASAAKIYFALIAQGVWCFCPQLSGLFPSAWQEHAISYEQWLAYDFAIIDRCTHVLLLPRWETSAGACREKEYAESLGKIVTTELERVIVNAACQNQPAIPRA